MNTLLDRRRSLRLVASAALIAMPALHLRAATPSGPRRRTPAQTEGPFYPDKLPADSDADLLANGTSALRQRPGGLGRRHARRHRRPRDRAARRSRSGSATRTATTTTRATAARPTRPSRASAASLSMPTAAGAFARCGRWPTAAARRTSTPRSNSAARELLTTQLYVQDDPGNARDGLWRRLSAEDRAAVTSPYVAGSDGLTARYALVIAA